MNDSLRTDVFVRYQPETVACACIYLTARKLKLPLPKNPSWFSIFGASEEEIQDISVKILKLYTRPKVNKLFVIMLIAVIINVSCPTSFSGKYRYPRKES